MERSGVTKILNRINHRREREKLLEVSSGDEVKKRITNGSHMSVYETTERPACSKGHSTTTFNRIKKSPK